MIRNFNSQILVGLLIFSFILISYQRIRKVGCDVLTDYFDTTTYSCAPCSAANNLDSALYFENSLLINNQFGCSCKQNLKDNEDVFGFQSTNSCVACDGETSCACKAGAARIKFQNDGEIIIGAQCVTCALNAYVSKDQTACIPCPHSQMAYNKVLNKCECTGDYVTAGDTCVSKADVALVGSLVSTDNLSQSQRIAYQVGNQRTDQTSALMQQLYLKSAVGCTVYKDIQSCQALANLCVINLYNEQALPCVLFSQKSSLQRPLGTQDNLWRQDYPWLYYERGTTIRILQAADYLSQVTFDATKQVGPIVHFLEYWIAIYNLVGELVDFRKLGTEFQLCPHSVQDGIYYREFGIAFNNNCNIDLSSYMRDRSSVYFYELFLNDPAQQSFIQIPVIINNFLDSILIKKLIFKFLQSFFSFLLSKKGTGNYPNRGGSDGFRFVRRFMIVDNVGANQNWDTLYIPSSLPTVMRVATEIKLKVTLRTGSDNNIYTPLLYITYTDISIDQGELTKKNQFVVYETQYVYNTQKFWDVCIALFITYFIVIGLIWFFRVYVWTLYNPPNGNRPSENYGLTFLYHAIVILLETSSEGLFYFLFVMTGYWFTFYKIQSTAYVLMPSQSTWNFNYYPFWVSVIIMFAFKAAATIALIWRQTSIDLFFIDWEKEKNYSNSEDNERGVSVWRNLFVANEFNELQTQRIVDLEWTLFILGFLMNGIKWENLAAETPNWTLENPKTHMNVVLKYFIGCFLFLVIGMVQIVFRKMFIIWFPTAIQDFADLCSVANVSIFILDSELHGFYLHGKAPSGIAEGNARWLQQSLDTGVSKGARGFLQNSRNDNDLQTFEMFVPMELRHQYDMHKNYKEQAVNTANLQGGATINQAVPKNIPIEKLNYIEASRKYLNDLITKYLGEIESRSTDQVVDKNPLQRLFNYPPINADQIKQGGLPIFYQDPQYEIKTIFYMGYEFTLLLFNIITYVMFDMLTKSTLIAIVITYTFDKLFTAYRNWLGERNISSKTFIDERFLI